MMQLTSKYRIDQKLGQGGMGKVFRGEMVGFEGFTRTVAIKMLRELYEGNVPAHARFAREARICGTLQHRNVVSVLDFDRSDAGEPFLVMEYVDGADLCVVMQSASLSIDAIVYVAAEVLRALAYAHDCGVIHRDIKPRNVLISRSGEVKLTDFGLAKLYNNDGHRAEQSTVKGTVGYIAPEIARQESVDHRADLFMIGVMLYELATGQLPFGKKSLNETIKCMFDEPPKEPRALRPDVPVPLNALILRLLRPRPDERPSNAEEIRNELSACADMARGAAEIAALDLADEESESAHASREEKKASRATLHVEPAGGHSDDQHLYRYLWPWPRLTSVSVLAVAAVALLAAGVLIGRDQAGAAKVAETSAPLAAENAVPADPESVPVIDVCTPVPVESPPARTTSRRERPRFNTHSHPRPPQVTAIPTLSEAPGQDPGIYPAEFEDLP